MIRYTGCLVCFIRTFKEENVTGMNITEILSILARIMLALAIIYPLHKMAGRIISFIATKFYLAFLQRYLSFFAADEDDMYIIANDYFEIFERIKFQ